VPVFTTFALDALEKAGYAALKNRPVEISAAAVIGLLSKLYI